MTQPRTEIVAARPYGLPGLVVSLFAAGVLTSVYLVLGVALAGLADFLVMGRDHLFGVLETFGDAFGEEEIAQFRLPFFIVGCVIYIAAILALLTVARWRGGRDWRALLAWRAFEPDGRFLVLTAAAVAYGLFAGWVIVKVYPEAKNWFQLPSGGAALTIAFALVVVCAPLAEELIFRGWLYTGLRARLTAGWTIGITAVLFALAHWEKTHLYALAVLPVGVLIGFVRERTGSARATILLHAVYNCSGFLAKLLSGD